MLPGKRQAGRTPPKAEDGWHLLKTAVAARIFPHPSRIALHLLRNFFVFAVGRRWFPRNSPFPPSFVSAFSLMSSVQMSNRQADIEMQHPAPVQKHTQSAKQHRMQPQAERTSHGSHMRYSTAESRFQLSTSFSLSSLAVSCLCLLT